MISRVYIGIFDTISPLMRCGNRDHVRSAPEVTIARSVLRYFPGGANLAKYRQAALADSSLEYPSSS
jgi:hypothetical protein